MSALTRNYFIFTVVLIVAGFLFKRSKFLFCLQMLWMWMLSAFNTGGMDYTVHTNIYAASVMSRLNFLEGNALYSLLCKFFYMRGFEFYVMNGVISTGIFLFLFSFIKKKSMAPCLVASLFFLYPLADCIIQKRWFFASMVAVAGIEYYLKNRNGVKNRVVFILSLLVAYEIHMASLVYILFATLFLVPEKYIKKLRKFLIMGAYISIPVMPFFAGKFFPEGKVRLYFVEMRLGTIDFLFWTCFHLAFIVIYWYLYRNEPCKPSGDYEKGVFDINSNINIYLPLYYYEPTFIRYFRGLLIYQYIEVSNAQPQNHIYRKRILLCTVFFCLAALTAFIIVYVITGAGFEYLILPIFEENIALEWIGKL